MLANLKEKFLGGLKKLSGNKDFLEAACAACALVAAADDEISDDEVKATVKAVSSNPQLLSAFKAGEIEKTIDAMLKRAQGGRVGRMGLLKELEQISSNTLAAETSYLCAADVADADGKVGDKEKKMLSLIAKTLSVNENSLLAV